MKNWLQQFIILAKFDKLIPGKNDQASITVKNLLKSVLVKLKENIFGIKKQQQILIKKKPNFILVGD